MLAEGVIRDGETNAISIITIIEEINAQGFPLFIPKIVFLALWERDLTDAATYDAQFSATLNDQILHTLPVTIAFGDARSHRSIITMQSLVIPQPGQVTFRLRVQDGPESSCVLPVNAPPSVVRID